ncbi:MAG: CoA pyrophosphatase [Chloroflexi bacterium]|nr:MAG: CoA pyrophosphatase [Chloroflexota bacterium]
MAGTASNARSLLGQDFFARARERLTLELPPGLADPNITPTHGDHDADPVMRAIAAVRPIRPAAVLVPIVDRPEPTVLLTQRTTELSSHAGQIAFPGGKIDPGDASPLAAALREASEEIGLDRRLVHPIGYLDLYLTTLGYRIVPTVAREVPLAFLMQPINHQRHSREWNGMIRHFYAIPFADRYIWGVTAGILRNLHDRIYRDDS